MSVDAIYCPERVSITAKLRDYLELTKPRIAVLELITVAVGALLAAQGHPNSWLLFHVLLGTWFIAGSASCLNHVLERHSDSRMTRTANRPLPAGRLGVNEAVWFGFLTLTLGFIELAVFVNWMTALLGLLSWQLYVWVYTPMKSWTVWNTLVGAIPGALPVVMGWTAIRGVIEPEAFALFLIVFLWQFPHFMAIAWICRDEYAAANVKMLPVVEKHGYLTGWTAVLGSAVLMLASLTPNWLEITGLWYLSSAVLLGLVMFRYSLRFLQTRTLTTARHLLRASLLYLPLLMIVMVCDSNWSSC